MVYVKMEPDKLFIISSLIRLVIWNGINFRSTLNQLDYFHVSSGTLLPDIFHDILEGIFPFQVKLLLKYF